VGIAEWIDDWNLLNLTARSLAIVMAVDSKARSEGFPSQLIRIMMIVHRRHRRFLVALSIQTKTEQNELQRNRYVIHHDSEMV
jgi:hypothetical protein